MEIALNLAPDIASGMSPRTSRLAIWSLILGLVGLIFVVLCLGPLFAIPGVICGHMAHSRIGRSAGTLAGQGLALGGIITGYCTMAFSILVMPLIVAIAIPNFVKARETAQQNACINNLRMIDGAKQQWAIEDHASEGDPITSEEIDTYLPSGFGAIQCPAGGTYSINAVGVDPTCSIPSHTLDSRMR